MPRKIYSMVIWLGYLSLAEGYQMYQDRIPNGPRVPHPCYDEYVWQGIGHLNQFGGGSRNPFGDDFNKNGKVWDECLCKKDSDGDGRTNGEELGDPNCVWNQGTLPEHTTGITHPGLCEPTDSAACVEKNEAFGDFCVRPVSECDLSSMTDVRTMTLRINNTEVPTVGTKFYCALFALPSDQDYHIVATEAIINNTNVLHHLSMFACEDSVDIEDDPPSTEASLLMQGECRGPGMPRCSIYYPGWTFGDRDGHCSEGKSYGYRFGKSSYKRIGFEYHWSNPEEIEGFWDSSGFIFSYTPVLLEHDVGILVLGPVGFYLPPGQPAFKVTGKLRAECFNLTAPVQIFATHTHMHYQGRKAKEKVYRDGQEITFLDVDSWLWDSPTIVYHDPPIELRPGDSLITECEYNTLLEDQFIYYGGNAWDEMCFNSHFFYPPLMSTSYYGSWRADEFEDDCWRAYPGATSATVEARANALDLYNGDQTRPLVEDVLNTCDNLGAKCFPGCQATIDAVLSSGHPSVGTQRDLDYALYIIRAVTRQDNFESAMRSCEYSRHISPMRRVAGNTCDDPEIPNSGIAIVAKYIVFITLITFSLGK